LPIFLSPGGGEPDILLDKDFDPPYAAEELRLIYELEGLVFVSYVFYFRAIKL